MYGTIFPLYLTENATCVYPAGIKIRPWGNISYEFEQLFVCKRAKATVDGTWRVIKVSIGYPIDLELIYSKFIK